MQRIVFDTNVLISALLFDDSRHRVLVETWRSERIRPLRSEATWQELLSVARRPEFDQPLARIEAAMADYARFTELIPIDSEACARLPRCRDRDDQKFLELAHLGQAEALLTYDQDLLRMQRRNLGFAIQTPEAWLAKGLLDANPGLRASQQG